MSPKLYIYRLEMDRNNPSLDKIELGENGNLVAISVFIIALAVILSFQFFWS